MSLHEETLRLRKETLGPEHPDTVVSMNNLARAYDSAGRWNEALPLYEEGLRLSRAKLGPEHPDTLAIDEQSGNSLQLRRAVERSPATVGGSTPAEPGRSWGPIIRLR